MQENISVRLMERQEAITDSSGEVVDLGSYNVIVSQIRIISSGTAGTIKLEHSAALVIVSRMGALVIVSRMGRRTCPATDVNAPWGGGRLARHLCNRHAEKAGGTPAPPG